MRVKERKSMKNEERIMAILDEIERLYPDMTTEHVVGILRADVLLAYEYAEKCNLHRVLTTIGHYNWIGGLYDGLNKKESEMSDVFDKIKYKIHDAESLLVNDLEEILNTKCRYKKR
jgi:hypothetical protein